MRTIRDPPDAKPARPAIDWQQLLVDAVTKPGVVSNAYHAFWQYSLGNAIWAHCQCLARQIEPGPLNTFKGWLKLDRFVRKGERAITLTMPVLVKRKRHDPAPDNLPPDDSYDPKQRHATYTKFVERPFWFVLSQTDGEPYTPLVIPQWNEELALYALGITRERFTHTDGNCQGYAHGRNVAVSLIAFQPHRTLLHEVAHVVLGHTAEVLGLSDSDAATPKDIRELEAECVAMLCCASLGMPGVEHSRGYVQHWFKSDVVPDRSVHRIFKAADAILKAGIPHQPAPAEAEAPAV